MCIRDRDSIHLETLVVSSDDDLTSLEEFYQSDRRNDRRIFQGNDELVNKVWKHEDVYKRQVLCDRFGYPERSCSPPQGLYGKIKIQDP